MGKSNFIIGLGVGSIIGSYLYRYACSPKGKMMKDKINHAFHKVSGDAVDMIDTAKDKAMTAGNKVADKVSEGAWNVAEKTDDMKNKVHNFNENSNNNNNNNNNFSNKK